MAFYIQQKSNMETSTEKSVQNWITGVHYIVIFYSLLYHLLKQTLSLNQALDFLYFFLFIAVVVVTVVMLLLFRFLQHWYIWSLFHANEILKLMLPLHFFETGKLATLSEKRKFLFQISWWNGQIVNLLYHTALILLNQYCTCCQVKAYMINCIVLHF